MNNNITLRWNTIYVQVDMNTNKSKLQVNIIHAVNINIGAVQIDMYIQYKLTTTMNNNYCKE